MQGTRGRPKFTVDPEIVLQQWRAGRSKKDLAAELNISRDTLTRILNDKGVNPYQRLPISDEDIDNLMLEVKCLLPNAGERLIIGHFRSKGYVFKQYISQFQSKAYIK